MSPIVLVGPGKDLVEAHRLLQQMRPALRFCYPDDSLAQAAEVAICWAPPSGSFARLPQLKLIHSVGAGADPIIREPSRPASAAVCRIVDPGHCQGMLEYVLWGVLHYHRRFDQILANQSQQRWERLTQHGAQQTRVGVMGLGQLGKAAAEQLARLGFATRGWARSAQPLPGVATFTEAQLPDFLDGLDILVCLLPLTERTQGILGAETFAHLTPGAALINCGRGGHLRVDDLLGALASGQLRGALLDVFEQEPLSREHPLWSTPGVTVTPHIASSASLSVIAEQILTNIDRQQAGLPLFNRVDTALGY
ncbi:2-hydroxyacid dehydrogenase [Pseudomonas sp. nanlin1]|uniref:2-hydroxyacid dehydrogenase n=1 Tax=Pseudomonas sp. nanlin1 TaxID=3040605 RepID=UPI00388FC9D1